MPITGNIHDDLPYQISKALGIDQADVRIKRIEATHTLTLDPNNKLQDSLKSTKRRYVIEVDAELLDGRELPEIQEKTPVFSLRIPMPAHLPEGANAILVRGHEDCPKEPINHWTTPPYKYTDARTCRPPCPVCDLYHPTGRPSDCPGRP